MPAMARAKVPLAGHGDLLSAASLLACVFMPACAPCSGFILRPHLSAMWCFVAISLGTKNQTPWVLSQVVTLWLVFVFPRPADSDLESAVQRPARCENTVNSFFLYQTDALCLCSSPGLGYTVPGFPNGFHSFSGEPLSYSAARHPSVSSLRHSSVGEDSTHALIGPDEQVNTDALNSAVCEQRA